MTFVGSNSKSTVTSSLRRSIHSTGGRSQVSPLIARPKKHPRDEPPRSLAFAVLTWVQHKASSQEAADAGIYV